MITKNPDFDQGFIIIGIFYFTNEQKQACQFPTSSRTTRHQDKIN